MKYEWKKIEKEYYLPKNKPVLIEIPKQKFITIDGMGNPNSEEFSKKVQPLYNISYKIKMIYKKENIDDKYLNYTVFPLEGIWSSTKPIIDMKNLNKDDFIYTIMIKQPESLDLDIFERAKIETSKKIDIELVNSLKINEYDNNLAVQMMHIGSFNTEYISFDILKKKAN